jgi:hypothetical protein
LCSLKMKLDFPFIRSSGGSGERKGPSPMSIRGANISNVSISLAGLIPISAQIRSLTFKRVCHSIVSL